MSDVLKSAIRIMYGDNEEDFDVECPYCDKDTDFKKVFREPYVSLIIENWNGEVSITASGDNRVSYYPKYCPECGRQLKEEDEQ